MREFFEVNSKGVAIRVTRVRIYLPKPRANGERRS